MSEGIERYLTKERVGIDTIRAMATLGASHCLSLVVR